MKDPESQNRTKHIDVVHHHVRELVEEGELSVEWIPSSIMLAEGLTKALPAGPFKKHQEEWGLVESGRKRLRKERGLKVRKMQ